MILKKLISKDIRRAEHEYMNIPPPPPQINSLVKPLSVGHFLCQLIYSFGYSHIDKDTRSFQSILNHIAGTRIFTFHSYSQKYKNNSNFGSAQ